MTRQNTTRGFVPEILSVILPRVISGRWRVVWRVVLSLRRVVFERWRVVFFVPRVVFQIWRVVEFVTRLFLFRQPWKRNTVVTNFQEVGNLIIFSRFFPIWRHYRFAHRVFHGKWQGKCEIFLLFHLLGRFSKNDHMSYIWQERTQMKLRMNEIGLKGGQKSQTIHILRFETPYDITVLQLQKYKSANI